MSWICRYCETENSDNSRNCEVCGKSKDLSSEPFEGNHITCKGIAITGSKEELLKKFSAKGFGINISKYLLIAVKILERITKVRFTSGLAIRSTSR